MKNQLTGYQVAGLVNKALDKVGEYPIPPQMIYTYIKKGFIMSFINASGQRVVSRREAGNFSRRFIANRQANRADAIEHGSCAQFVTAQEAKAC